MKILISGATGMVGQNLYLNLVREGHDVFRLMRSVSSAAGTDLVWDPLTGKAESARFEGFDAVVHLGGENIASQKWSEERKQQLIESRVHFTTALCNALTKQLHSKPKTFISASGIGIFGSRDYDDILHEDSKLGDGFLANLAKDWELAAKAAAEERRVGEG